MEFVNYGYGHAAKRPSAPPNGTVYFAIDDGSLSFYFNGWKEISVKEIATKLIFNDKEVTAEELLDYSKPIINTKKDENGNEQTKVLTFGYYYTEQQEGDKE